MPILSFRLFRVVILIVMLALWASWLLYGEDPRRAQRPALRVPENVNVSVTDILRPTPVPVQTLANGVIVGPEARHDTSPPLRDIPPSLSTDAREPYQEPEGEEERERQERARARQIPRAKDTAVQATYPSVLAVPSPIHNFDGAYQYDGVLDPNGDVGPNHYVQMINFRTQIWNKHTGASVYGPIDNNVLFTGFGAPCETESGVDPIVLFDQLADRWLLSYLVGQNNGGGMCLAISQTSDPTWAYHRYYFPMRGGLYDYPKFGIWPNGYYMTSHYRYDLPDGGLILEETIVAFDRAKMLNGQTATFQEFPQPGANTLTPSDLDGSTQPPAGSPNFVGELDKTTNNKVNIRKVSINWTTPSNSSVVGPIGVTVAPYTYGDSPAHQGGPPMWSLADPLMFRLSYRNFGTYQMLLGSHYVKAGSNNGIRWYEIRNPGGTPTVYQQGTYAPDTKYRWIPSIAMDRVGNIMLGYNTVTASTEPGIAYTGRLAGDPLGQMTQGEAILAAGSGTYTGNRWGDYSAMVVDSTDDCTFWFTSQYLKSGAVRTRIAAMKFPSCTAINPTPTPIAGATNVALNKTTTGSTACQSTETPPRAVDGSLTTKWCSLAATKWIQIDLGASYSIKHFLIKHAGAGGEWSGYNTKAFTIQLSPNGTSWSTVVNVTNNVNNMSRHTITSVSARYVKLNVTTATQDGNPSEAARIYELEVYGGGGSSTPLPTATPTPSGTASWAPNVAYTVGTLVAYNGATYRCLQAHTSQVGWEPPNVPSLWQPQ